jgi:hypothetical protein
MSEAFQFLRGTDPAHSAITLPFELRRRSPGKSNRNAAAGARRRLLQNTLRLA